MADDLRYKRVGLADARVIMGLLDRELRALELQLRYGQAADKAWE